MSPSGPPGLSRSEGLGDAIGCQGNWDSLLGRFKQTSERDKIKERYCLTGGSGTRVRV